MRKIATSVTALFVAGVLGLACSDHSGLTFGAVGSGGGAKGGQAGSTGGNTVGSGGTVGTGGGGGVSTGGTSGDTGGTGGCPSQGLCVELACVGGLQPNPDPCGCPICAPTPDAGVAKDAGNSDAPRICPLAPCPLLACPYGTLPIPDDPCGCPICEPGPGPDAGVARDTGGPDGPRICPMIACLMPACVGGFQPNPDPCGCPICAPIPDAGAAKDPRDAIPRTPLLHRASGSTCPAGRAPGLSLPLCNCFNCGCAGLCGGDSDCTKGTDGRCLMTSIGAAMATCSYDECASDSDCPANVPCDCRPSVASSAANSCVTGSDCRVDSDCGPGGFCSPSLHGQWCGSTYHCHTASDTCVNDSDCTGAGCNFNQQLGHWACGGDCAPPPP